MSAGLFRKLLLDGSPLMGQVNASHRLKLRFRINGETALERVIHEDKPMYGLLEDAIDPRSSKRLAGQAADLQRSGPHTSQRQCQRCYEPLPFKPRDGTQTVSELWFLVAGPGFEPG